MERGSGGGLWLWHLLIVLAAFVVANVGAKFHSEPTTELILVQAVVRHGDRYPSKPIRNHTEESYKLDTLGQLTRLGMQEQYELGEFLRYHYASLRLKWESNAVEMTAQSSDLDRAISSAACLLAALYRPDDPNQRFSESLAWVPVPVHSPASPADNFLRLNVPCPTYINALETLQDSPAWKNGVGKEESAILKDLKLKFGPNTIIADWIDTVLVERSHNLSLTNADEAILSRQLKNWIGMYRQWHKLPEYRRLQGGPILSRLVDNMNRRVNNTDSRRKMALFSTHDNVVMALLSALGTPLEVVPLPTSSAVLMELHVDTSDPSVHFVKVLLRNDSELDPYVLTLPECDTLCPLNEFLNLTRPVIPVNLDEECNPRPEALRSSSVSWTASVFVVAMTALLVALVVYLLLKHHRRSRDEYHEQYQIVR